MRAELADLTTSYIQEVTLERLWQSACVSLDARALASMPPEHLSAVLRNEVVGALMLHIDLLVPGEKLADIECRWPADWRQAFKERWFPAWAKRRWPVRWERRHLEAQALYPLVSMPRAAHTIRILVDGKLSSGDWNPAALGGPER